MNIKLFTCFYYLAYTVNLLLLFIPIYINTHNEGTIIPYTLEGKIMNVGTRALGIATGMRFIYKRYYSVTFTRFNG